MPTDIEPHAAARKLTSQQESFVNALVSGLPIRVISEQMGVHHGLLREWMKMPNVGLAIEAKRTSMDIASRWNRADANAALLDILDDPETRARDRLSAIVELDKVNGLSTPKSRGRLFIGQADAEDAVLIDKEQQGMTVAELEHIAEQKDD